MFEFSGRDTAPPDGLFLERLDTFMNKCLADIKAFSEREYRPYEETRQYVAEWHSRYLFQPPPFEPTGETTEHGSASKVRSILCNTSRILESLCETAGVQSFLLAVDPNNPTDGGFLGGSVIGREFWRGLRGGGEAGAKTFKTYCLREIDSNLAAVFTRDEEHAIRAGSSTTKQGLAKPLKNELYENVRKTLRSTSGVRNAEMKWTNPEKLDVYGVRLVGWPSSIPAQNPSTLRLSQNKLLLECLENGTMRFERTYISPNSSRYPAGPSSETRDILGETDSSEDFSWAYDADAGGPSPVGSLSTSDVVIRVNGSQAASQDAVLQQPWDNSLISFHTEDLTSTRQTDVDSSDRIASILSSSSITQSSSSRKRPRKEQSDDER